MAKRALSSVAGLDHVHLLGTNRSHSSTSTVKSSVRIFLDQCSASSMGTCCATSKLENVLAAVISGNNHSTIGVLML
jgi:hypothetical protein